jgi:D-serine deaminase-like pyridoxal phosphate-dependent protein
MRSNSKRRSTLQPSRAQVGSCIYDLDTPATLVDLDRLEKNIRDRQAVMNECGVKFRPHIKTHKIPEIARLQLSAGAVGIVSSKVSEAEPFADHGISDICIAYPVFGEKKWQRLAELAKRVQRLTINCDNAQAAAGLSCHAKNLGVSIHVQIDVDSGLHRGGIPCEEQLSIEHLARTIQSLPGLQFDGITTFRSSGFAGAPCAKEAGDAEGRLLVEIANRLRSAGIEVKEVTAGSTPTGLWVARVPGVTEVRSGTYVFNDLMQLQSGVVDDSQLAFSVLCTVVSKSQNGRLTIDGGSKTFSGDAGSVGKDGTTAPIIARGIERPITVERLSEEHGVARNEDPVELGEKIRVIPYHACTCLNLTDELIGFRGERVEVVWPVVARGLRT